MTPDKKNIETIYETTATDGWKLLVKDVQEKFEAIKEALISSPYDAYAFGVLQGRVQIYRELITLRDSLALALKQEDNPADE